MSSAATITPALGAGPLKAAIAITREMIPYSLPYSPMLSVKRVAAAAVVAVVVSACSSAVKPPQGRGKLDDQRTYKPNHFACLRQLGLPAQLVGQTGIQIGQPPAGPTIQFLPTPGAAQYAQIQGQALGAEVIGSALLYPNGASESELTRIENCVAKGVTG
jgi:hypothetical protein